MSQKYSIADPLDELHQIQTWLREGKIDRATFDLMFRDLDRRTAQYPCATGDGNVAVLTIGKMALCGRCAALAEGLVRDG